MIIRYFHVSLYMYVVSFCICMVHVFTFISFSGLHLFIKICPSGMFNGGGMYLYLYFVLV